MSAPEPAPLPDDLPDEEPDTSVSEEAGDASPSDGDPDASVAASAAPERDAAAEAAGHAARLEEVRRSVVVLGDRVLVAPPDDAERKSKGGILIPATARSVDRKGIWGEAVAIGPHVRQVGVGDDLLYLPEDAIEVDVQGDAYLIVRERDVHAVASTRRDGATGLYL
jgi:chaperonin GroES